MRPVLLWSGLLASACLAGACAWTLSRPESPVGVEATVQEPPSGEYPGDGTSFAVIVRVSNTSREPARILSVASG